MTASYLHDSLDALARSAVDLRNGSSTATVVFMDEPGEHHLILSRARDDELRVEVRWFNDWASWNMHPADQFDTVFEGRTTIPAFVSAVVGVLDDVLKEWGVDGYLQKWVEHPFPKEMHGQLAAR